VNARSPSMKLNFAMRSVVIMEFSHFTVQGG
jgi:hypothetical protein